MQSLREALLDRDPTAVAPVRGELQAVLARREAQRRARAAAKAAAEAAARLDAEQRVALGPRRPPRCTPQQAHRWLRRVSESPRLQWCVTAVVVLSVCLMGCSSTCDAPPGQALGCAPGSEGGWSGFEARVETAMLLSSLLLVAETLLKLAALGAWAFLSDALNQMDLLISAVSLADLALSGTCRLAHPAGGGGCDAKSSLSSLSALRSLRLVRVLRLLRNAPSLRALLMQLVDLVRSAWSLMLLILLLAYTFALVGVVQARPQHATPGLPLCRGHTQSGGFRVCGSEASALSRGGFGFGRLGSGPSGRHGSTRLVPVALARNHGRLAWIGPTCQLLRTWLDQSQGPTDGKVLEPLPSDGG